MNLVLEPRHRAMLGGAVLLAAGGYFLTPYLMPVHRTTVYAFPVAGLAWLLGTLASAAGNYRVALNVSCWIVLAGAGVAGGWPLLYVWADLQSVYLASIGAGASSLEAMWDVVLRYGSYSDRSENKILLAFGIGGFCLAGAGALPLAAILNPRIGRDRAAPTGPWEADWMDKRDIAYLARNKTGTPLARHKGKLLRYTADVDKGWLGGHHLVVAGTRGGKGVSAVIPTILEHQGPVVALDIKGENFAVTRRHRKKLGRTVAVLNPFGLIEEPSDRFNPLDYIRPNEMDRDIGLVADGLVKTEPGESAHFSELARQLVAGAIEVVITQEEPERRNLNTVADLILSQDLDATLRAWAENADLAGRQPAQIAATILRTGDRERGGIESTASKAFSWMASDEMRRFLSRSTFHMDDLLDDRLDLFIVVPLDSINRQAVFMRLFINLVLGTVVRQDGWRKVEAPILLALDEFVRMGWMEQIVNIANVAAGLDVQALFVAQDIGQVEQTYGPHDARSIFASCATKRVFNLGDPESAEWAARHLGERTVFSQQVREGKAPVDRRELSYSEQRQKLMTAEEILAMKSDEVLLLTRNKGALLAKLSRYYEAREYRGGWDRNPLA